MSTSRPKWRPLLVAALPYGVAVLAVLAALMIAFALNAYFSSMAYVSLFLCAILFAAWFGGLGPSVVAMLLAVLCFGYIVFDAKRSLGTDLKEIPRIVLFSITALFVISVSVAQRRSSEEVQRINSALSAENAERKRTESYLDEAQALSRTGSFGWKAGNTGVFWSKGCWRVLEIDDSDEPSMELMLKRAHVEDRLSLQSALASVAKVEGAMDCEIRWRTSTGSMKRLHIRAHRTKLTSGEDEVVGALMDVTEIRSAHEALQASQASLARASRVATIGEMSASIAHEVNQPLAGIVTNGEAGLRWLDREEPQLGEVRGVMERMICDAIRASEVVQRLYALVRKSSSRRQPLDFNDVVSESAALLQREIQMHRVVLSIELATGSAPVIADRIELQQVIINLMVNGMQAMEPVTDRPRHLLIRSVVRENEVLVAVQDSGVGLDSASMARLFSPFFTTREGGVGLGLSICRTIIEAHGGRIWASSNDGPGATFQIALPLQLESGH
jgi:C4-dicarboxylate-specific signal transduction histidine kinase